MSNIFKIYINNNNDYSKLYLFIKNKYNIARSESDLELPSIELLNKNYYNYSVFSKSSVYSKYFSNDFNETDNEIIKEGTDTGIFTIIFVDDVINYDDTIETIKLKFIHSYNNSVNEDEKVCFEELYMYSLTQKNFNTNDLFNILTNHNKIELTKSNIIKYLANIYEREIILSTLQEDKESYNYDDLTQKI